MRQGGEKKSGNYRKKQRIRRGMLPYMLQLITRNANKIATTIIIGVLTGLLLYCTFSIRNGGQPVRKKQPGKSEAYLPPTTAYDKMLTLSNSHDIYA